jgi:hypothetical protein
MRRRRLTEAYRERDLYERPFTSRQVLARVAKQLRDFPLTLEKLIHRLTVRAGAGLRHIPGLSRLLDARLRRIRRRAEGRSRHRPRSL